jgi:hypothetical protein
MRVTDFGPGRWKLFPLIAALAFPARVFAQGGLPPKAGQIVREGMSRPRIRSIEPLMKAGAGPAGCVMRDAAVALLGGNFGPSADGRKIMASRRGAPIGFLPVLSWAPSRIEARLNFGADIEGETVTLDLVDARGESATIGGRASFAVCYRDQTFLGGHLRIPACSSERRQFRVVAEGAARLERLVNVAPHAPSAPYGFASLALGSWTVSVSEVALHPTPTPRPGTLVLPPPPRASSVALPGCSGFSLGFDAASQSIVISDARRRATGVDFVERLITLPHPGPPDFRGLGGPTPTPTPSR